MKANPCPCTEGGGYGLHSSPSGRIFLGNDGVSFEVCNAHLKWYVQGRFTELTPKKKEAKKKKMLQQQPIETPNDVWIKRWSVVGTSGKNYTVALKNDGTYGCDCPSWKFQKKNLSGQRNPCQHILRILLQIRLENGEGSSVSTPRRENFTVKKVTVDPPVTRRIRFEK